MKLLKCAVWVLSGILSSIFSFGQYQIPNDPLWGAQQLTSGMYVPGLTYIEAVWAYIPGQGNTMVSMYWVPETGDVFWENPLDPADFGEPPDDTYQDFPINEWDFNSQIANAIVNGNWTALDNLYEKQSQFYINYSLSVGHAVQLIFPDGTTQLLTPDQVPKGAATEIVKDANGNLALRFETYSDMALNSSLSSLQGHATTIAEKNVAQMTTWLRRDLSTAEIGAVQDASINIGPGAFAHSFDGWIHWSDELGAWDTSVLTQMFAAESLYQVPVFQIGYKLGAAIGAKDPVTGNPLSSSGLFIESLVDGGSLIIAYKITPPTSGLGSYVDDLLSAEVRVFKTETNVWNMNPFSRGFAIEEIQGTNLPKNFPVIDRFSNGQATSLKSLDIRAATYQDTGALAAKVNRYVDAVAAFNGESWAGYVVEGSAVTARRVELVIPPGITVAQQAALNESAERAASIGVELIVIVLP